MDALTHKIMNPKNWNDRADKDLFFTILSVKNIGIISGGEWTTIGNHMRSMGYGFTNEGCRQHFQGLRRAQSKAEASGIVLGNPRFSDPTLNPITRRPGPGRGRPKKQLAPGEGGSMTEEGQMTVESGHDATDLPGPAPLLEDEDQKPALLQGHEDAAEPAIPDEDSALAPEGDALQAGVAGSAPGDLRAKPEPESDAEAENSNQPPMKRVKYEESELEELDDEAVLALAAHNGAAGADYAEDFDYDET